MIPLAKPLVGAREEELVLETLRSRRLALGPRLPRPGPDMAPYLEIELADLPSIAKPKVM